ncbi:MAG: DUF2125 domain-containing protein [Paracoccaceae bacterium]
MRKLIFIVIAAAVLYGGYWFVAARGMEAGLNKWLDARAESGWVTDRSSLTVQGFPNRLDTTVEDLTLSVPGTGLTWKAPFFQVLALSYRPNRVIAVWPHEQSLTAPGAGTVTIRSKDMRASAAFTPTTDLTLDHSTMVVDGLGLRSDQGWTLAAGNLRLATRPEPDRRNGYEIGFQVSALHPSDALMRRIGLAGAAPATMQLLNLDGVVELNKPLDRHVLDGAPAQITALRVKSLLVQWGDMELKSNGGLSVGADGRIGGEVTLQLTDWKGMLRVAVAAGVLSSDVVTRITPPLEKMAALSVPDDSTLDVPLKFTDGKMYLGPVPLGPAPVLGVSQRQ